MISRTQWRSRAFRWQPPTDATEVATAMRLLGTRYPEYAAFPMPKSEEIALRADSRFLLPYCARQRPDREDKPQSQRSLDGSKGGCHGAQGGVATRLHSNPRHRSGCSANALRRSRRVARG